eukprot:184391-Pyramimonas_sp.AAC.1
MHRFWELCGTAAELRVQRSRWYQAMAREPENHKLVFMAIFGAAELDRQLGRPRLQSGGRPAQR